MTKNIEHELESMEKYIKSNDGGVGLTRLKFEHNFKINHFNAPIDFSIPIHDQISEDSYVITLQTVKCLYSKYFSADTGGSVLIIVEDDADNKLIDYINCKINRYNDFLIQLLDYDMKILSNVHAKNCELSSISSEVNYAGKGAHQLALYFKAAEIVFFK